MFRKFFLIVSLCLGLTGNLVAGGNKISDKELGNLIAVERTIPLTTNMLDMCKKGLIKKATNSFACNIHLPYYAGTVDRFEGELLLSIKGGTRYRTNDVGVFFDILPETNTMFIDIAFTENSDIAIKSLEKAFADHEVTVIVYKIKK